MAARAVSLKGIFFIFLGSSSNQEVSSAYMKQAIYEFLALVPCRLAHINHISNKKLCNHGRDLRGPRKPITTSTFFFSPLSSNLLEYTPTNKNNATCKCRNKTTVLLSAPLQFVSKGFKTYWLP